MIEETSYAPFTFGPFCCDGSSSHRTTRYILMAILEMAGAADFGMLACILGSRLLDRFISACKLS